MSAEHDFAWVLSLIALVVGPALIVGLLVALGYLFGVVVETIAFVARRLRGL